MSERQAAIAQAFSTHRFSEAYPHLADDVRWTLVGGSTIVGKEGVIATCEQTLKDLASVSTELRRIRVIDAGTCAVVESIGEYREPDNALSVVASCDIVDFTDGLITDISSYTVELTDAEVQNGS